MTTAGDRGAEAFGRWLFAQDCRFVTGAASIEAIPEAGLPEVAFAGRSNVGKSSLVNALTGRTTLARTSRTPGRTQQLNFFDLGGLLLLVDLPGYGYARAARTRVEQWTDLLRSYLTGRPTLRRLCLLVDARHGIKASDGAFMDLLDGAAVVYQIVLTKSDKLRPEATRARREEISRALSQRAAAFPEVAVTSARDLTGVDELRASIAGLARERAIR
ncbi:MAG: ribosome biogenesis GTP-binding protein YihA/YsxC [Alphaproteobacteria bacterium]